jgi:transposase-like protein
MRPELVVCPNPACGASGHIGVHSYKERRYVCHACDKTFAETTGTPLYGLKQPIWLVVVVLALLAAGCPIPAIVFAFGLDERTVTDWHVKAGWHAQQIQEQAVCQGQVEIGQVQGDELYVKTQYGTVWMATAMSVFSRLWLWGAIAGQRDTALITQVVQQVRAAARLGQPILWAVDGFAAWTKAILLVFRDPQRSGKRGRPPLIVWADLHIVQVVKQYRGRRLTGVQRRLAHGCISAAEALMQASQVGLGVINTAYIERLNATFRTWIPALTRRSRTPARQETHLEAAMFWMGVVYNFCRTHTTLGGTPAMAADLTDHRWTVEELLRYRVKRE